jgi:glycosyltransferase involved in cell wall biosynthesis
VPADLVCLSHLRWDFVYQRPNHLMARAAHDRRVLFVEEPEVEDGAAPAWRLADRSGVCVAVPVLPPMDEASTEAALALLLDELLRREAVVRPVAWFYTPVALPWSRRLLADASAVVYDSMDHLAGFRDAPPRLVALEDELLAVADLVFTGGASLHARLRRRHRDAHAFPSSVDVAHFATARHPALDRADQAPIPRPRIGYAGVIDERLDLDLVRGVAESRPGLELVLLGPVAKIDPADIPDLPNVHQLGPRPYAELPSYLRGWDVGWMPFARNEATRYISPTKTPEYLAAGLPVVSTSIHDVVEPYGRLGFVSIADDVAGTLAAVDAVTAGRRAPQEQVDAFLSAASWDRTWAAMDRLIADVTARRSRHRAAAVRRTRPAPVTRPAPATRPAAVTRPSAVARPSSVTRPAPAPTVRQPISPVHQPLAAQSVRAETAGPRRS